MIPSASLYLIVNAPELGNSLARIPELIDRAPACVCVDPGGDEELPESALALIETFQDGGTAVLLMGDPLTAAEQGFDGVHLSLGDLATLADVLELGVDDTGTILRAVREIVGRDASLGFDPEGSRHAALEAGEANVDYVAFAPDARLTLGVATDEDAESLISWWSEVVQVPGVAWGVTDLETAEVALEDGAEFIAVDVAAVLADDPSGETLAVLTGADPDVAREAGDDEDYEEL